MRAVAGAAWVGWVFGAVFAAVALLCAARLLASRQDGGSSTDRGVDASLGLMSLGMAAMFLPWGALVPTLGWQVLFSMAAGYLTLRLLRRRMRSAKRGTELHLLLGSLAMVYVLAAVPAGHGMAGMDMPGMGSAGLAFPALAWALAGYFLVFAVRLGARLVEPVSTGAASSAGLGGGPRGVVTSPHLLGSCEVVMGVGMSYMLVTML
ncbi:MAG TPA: DUF5134 domain-containing protein [Pseudonocardiaceae bacterium]